MNYMNARFCSSGWKSMVLSSVLLVYVVPLYANGSSLISNSTLSTNSSNGVELKPALPDEATPITRVHSRKPRAGQESEIGGETATTTNVESSERKHLMDLTAGGMAAKLPTLADPQTRSLSQLDFSEESSENSTPRWKSEILQADGTLLDVDRTPYESTHSPPEETITVSFYNPPHHHHISNDRPWVQQLQGGDPTSWTLSDFYDYLSPDYTPTEVYPDESQPTPPDMEDENWPFVASAVPSNKKSFGVEDGGSGVSDPAGSREADNLACLPGFLRINETCLPACTVITGYCFNGGQCYVIDSIGAFCRCNVQEFIWNKGSRCQSAISDFQVMCIAVGGATIMLLTLFMVIVFFSKKLYLLKTENGRLRKRSKSRPQSEQPVDNFSLCTVRENSQSNKTMSRYTWEYKPKEDCGCEDETTKEEPDCPKCPPKEEEPLNIQNSLTPNHENNKEAGEDNAEEGGVTIDLELLLPKEAKTNPETSRPLHYNVFLYKLPKSPKKSPVLRRPPGRSGQTRPLSQICPRRSSEPGYSPISTRSLPGVLSGSSSPHLGTAYTP
ncbi:chondroitin sulfate proteoglycan 5b isoform X2 [Triplophysa dalaica]|uniref:chondroitin sulfate proteoglycan 5b isoform X2 n=1 Tax=Triplophysa dalaica TaxID=1582913 RepID=UPI0024E00A13|nr:chondroitin sulfate proteoglycan 5b isoform X2 [Triplophysa dalaica]